ncbi:cactin-like [Rana temporaria]|uniref:cactin-like n=1 Tax=Rana temporaria TaxID=8407 RepID=UPI001AAC9DFB|nr:cactin-like [Rana temporaria]
MGILKDPMDKRMDQQLKRAWQSIMGNLKPAMATTCVSRNMEYCLTQIKAHIMADSPKQEILDSFSTLSAAVAYVSDASAESIRMTARSTALTNSGEIVGGSRKSSQSSRSIGLDHKYGKILFQPNPRSTISGLGPEVSLLLLLLLLLLISGSSLPFKKFGGGVFPVKSKIRIRDGRAKPIDLLAKYISAEDDDLAVEMHEPYTFLTGLTVSDLEDLLEDIRIYMELEQGKNVDFWKDMTIITEDEISKLRKLESFGKGPGERREGVNASVCTDVQAVFKGKTYSQLQVISQGIESKIKAGGPNLDIGYWESLLQQLRAYMARARLRERHQDILRQKLFKLKQEQGVESEPLFPIVKQEPCSPCESSARDESEQPGPSSDVLVPDESGSVPEGEGKEECGESVLIEEDLIQQSLNDYDVGRYSPKLLTNQELPFDAHIVDFEEDQQRLVLCRQQLQVTGDACESAEDIFIRKAKEGMDGDEARFSVEIPVTSKAYLWADKYRPRKPRFFNRVHTGFEWNKYNQTHYDFDNPPPKIVQGYKFNIFYPDLIDKRSTPEYFLEACQDNKDFAILRFHAGPPYEDIAFKIVNREWEYSHRHGFRCQFSNGIFQLWFHFKRYRYRR